MEEKIEKVRASRKRLIDKVLNMSEARVKYFRKISPIDKLMAMTLLKYFPSSVTPNQITLFRFATIPFIIFLLLSEQYLAGTILFMFSAFSDALDGAMARTQNHVTSWGILCDPLADKLLIGSVALILITKFISWPLAISIVAIEIILIASSYYRYSGRVVPAKTVAKIKMVLQCFGIIFLLYYVLSSAPTFLSIATYTLYLSVVFALLSLLVYRSI